MAPEILKGSSYCEKVDIWSLGVLLFEILQGGLPFKGKSQIEKVRKINNNSIEYNFSISLAAKQLISRILSMDPALRPDIDEILTDE